MKKQDIESIGLGFDVIIVGAGVAGCTLANNLSKELKILLIDQKVFPRHKACSGILVKESIDFLKGEDLEKILVTNTLIYIEYFDSDNNKSKIIKKNFLNSNRFLLDKYLHEKIVQKENIYFLENTRLIECKNTKDNKHLVILIESNGIIKPIITTHLVGCDGASSTVRKNILKKDIRFYIGMQELLKTNKQFDHAYFIFDNQITDFYSWIIPKPPYTEIGTLLDPSNTKEKYAQFKQKLSTTFGIKEDGKIDSSIVLRPESAKDICLGDKNILLCGEAAGLISPSSAEGISYALNSGYFCAMAINTQKDNVFEEYSKNCKEMIKRLQKKFEKSRIISDKNKRKMLFN